ncbi:MAG TPA: hypothetical protein ENF53_03415 [Thermoprotei archaeon]|nr:hypothetical protein [Thermoprotei archaeon]
MIVRFKLLVRVIKAMGKMHFATKYAYFVWVFPFEVVQLVIDILLWFFFVNALGGSYAFEEKYSVNPIHFLLIGIIASRFLNYNVSGIFSIVRNLFQSSYSTALQRLSYQEYLSMYNIEHRYWLIGVMFWEYFRTCIIAVIYLLVGYLGFGLRLNISPDGLLLALLTFILGIIATLGIGMVSAGVYLYIGVYRGAEPVQWTIRLLSKIISGTYFPVETLPIALQYIALILPHTHTLTCLRNILLIGKGIDTLSLEILIIQAIAFPLIGYLLFKLGLKKHFKRGTLI